MKNIPSLAEQYRECLLCDGYNYQCKRYFDGTITFESPDICFWYKSMEEQLDRIAKHKQFHSRGTLAKILEDDK